MTIDLDQVVLDGGRQFVNFFEGRILTGRDLRDEQSAARQGRNALGRGIGAGVVHGFEVTDATPVDGAVVPTVRIAAGLAINREGQSLDLKAARTLRLAVLDPDSPDRNRGVFDLCADQPSTSDAPTAEGFHILTVAPATAYQEEAPKSGLEDAGSAGGCGRRYVTLGVRFRLVRFDPALIVGGSEGSDIATLATGTSITARSRLRNLVAHLGLGGTTRSGFPADPFAQGADDSSAYNDWDLEARLSAGANQVLEACEVPLAVLRLRGGQFSFIDMWSVRRAPRTPAVAADWPLIGVSARTGTDAATLYQFQEHLDWLLSDEGVPQTLAANAFFTRLPPAGFLPFASAASFLPDAPDPIDLDPARVIPIVEEALAYPSVNLDETPSPGFTIYRNPNAPDWIMFISDAVPSEERQAQKCADLEDRISALEILLNTPGTITGLVQFRFVLGGGTIDTPVPGAVVSATLEDGTAPPVTATTDAEGRYEMSVPPGDYTVSAVLEGQSLSFPTRQVSIARGEAATVNLLSQSTFGFVARDG